MVPRIRVKRALCIIIVTTLNGAQRFAFDNKKRLAGHLLPPQARLRRMFFRYNQ
jgi:hypothetical protein